MTINLKKWLFELFLILKENKNNSLLIGYFYMFIFLLIPSISFLQIISPIIVIIWPAFVVNIVMYFHARSKNKARQLFKLTPEIKVNIMKLMTLGIITFFYAMLVSFLISTDMQEIIKINQGENLSIEPGVALRFLLKLFLFMLPVFISTWFSPMLIALKNYSVINSLKSSIAAFLIYFFPMLLAFVFIFLIFFLSIFILQSVFDLLKGFGSFVGVLNIISMFSLIAIFISTLFIFQYISYRDIFKIK
jgi:hypothetical protein